MFWKRDSQEEHSSGSGLRCKWCLKPGTECWGQDCLGELESSCFPHLVTLITLLLWGSQSGLNSGNPSLGLGTRSLQEAQVSFHASYPLCC